MKNDIDKFAFWAVVIVYVATVLAASIIAAGLLAWFWL